jgi:hypothetical protein
VWTARWTTLTSRVRVGLLNKRIGIVDRTKPTATLPHPLDTPDYSLARDCQDIGPLEPQ